MTGEGGVTRGAAAQVPGVLELLRRLVEVESPSGHAAGVEEAAGILAGALEACGARVRMVPAPGYGSHLVADLGPEGGGRPLLVVGHLDTVHPVGTLEVLPFAERDGRLRGPGVYDMKGGLAVLVGALRVLEAEGVAPAGPVRVLVTADEEVGAPTSKELLEKEGRCARGALVLEPPLPGGGVKARRKGIAVYRVQVEGRPAHAGIEPERGASAVHELARLIVGVVALGDPDQGTTVNVGLISGGTAGNVVAAHAAATVDVRFWTRAEGERVDRTLRVLRAADPRCDVRIEGGVNRGAMEESPGGAQLLARARAVAAAAGRVDLPAGGTGGGSDGNILAAVGCPVLDGLGPEGDGAHTLDEHLEVGDLPFRIALVAGLLRSV